MSQFWQFQSPAYTCPVSSLSHPSAHCNHLLTQLLLITNQPGTSTPASQKLTKMPDCPLPVMQDSPALLSGLIFCLWPNRLACSPVNSPALCPWLWDCLLLLWKLPRLRPISETFPPPRSQVTLSFCSSVASRGSETISALPRLSSCVLRGILHQLTSAFTASPSATPDLVLWP